jgi:broad specificity phosphatase PhoE
MGRKQADETGKRLAQMIQGIQGDPGSPCNIKVVHVSGLARAKETADIIASHFPQVERSDPDPLLNEGRYEKWGCCFKVASGRIYSCADLTIP